MGNDPNPASAKDKAEGDRDPTGEQDDSGTISNRPRDEERNEEVPPRGERKEDQT